MKPLGAGLYWKPVALTKNPTVEVYGAFVAAVSYRWVAQRETVNPSVAFTQELSHILIHPAAPYGSVLLETSSSNCKSGWSHNRILCELWVCLNCYCCSLLSIRKRICFKVQVLITDMGLLPIKVREWILLQLCSHFSFSDWTEKKSDRDQFLLVCRTTQLFHL